MIIVSTSGFSYDDWVGRFYPAELPKAEQLPWFSQYFKAVELNYTYYSPPGAKGIEGHMRKGPGMKFALKAHGCFTHKRSYTQKDLDIYRSAMDQLAAGDALLAMLMQFPYSFHAKEENLDYVAGLLRDFSGYPLAVEFRQARWKNRTVFDFFTEQNITLVTTDAPAQPNLYRGGWEQIGPFSYVRLHGRNFEKWWEHDEGWERYNYLYSQREIGGMADGVRSLAGVEQGTLLPDGRSPRDVYVFFNNHWQAQGAINALQLAQRLGIELPEALPPLIRDLLKESG